jgi:hypothetical protein
MNEYQVSWKGKSIRPVVNEEEPGLLKGRSTGPLKRKKYLVS